MSKAEPPPLGEVMRLKAIEREVEALRERVELIERRLAPEPRRPPASRSSGDA